jgi:hypothetical protein
MKLLTDIHHSAGRRAGVAAVLVIVGVAVVYLAGANLALAWVAHRGDRSAGVSFRFASAYTVVPGRVHVEQLHLSGVADGGWRADVARADLKVGLLDLLTRTARLHQARLDGVSVEIDVDPGEVAFASAPAPRDPHRLAGSILGASLATVGAVGGVDDRPASRKAAVDGELRIDEVEASVRSLSFHGVRVAGEVDVEHAQMLVLRRVGTTLEAAHVEVHGATVADGDETVLRDLEGRLDLGIAPDRGAAAPLLSRLKLRVELSGRLASPSPLLSSAALKAADVDGVAHVVGTLSAGIIEPSSRLGVEIRHAKLAEPSEVRNGLELPQGLSATLEAPPAPASRLRLTLSAPRLVVHSLRAAAATTADTFDGVTVSADAWPTTVGAPSSSAREVSWKAESALVWEGGTSLAGAVGGHFQLTQHGSDPSALLAGTGALEATDVVAQSPGAAKAAPFTADVQLTSAVLARDGGLTVAGHVHAQGADADTVLTLLDAKPAVRLALGSLDGQAFTLDAALRRTPDTLDLEDVALSSHGAQVNGVFVRHLAEERAAFVLRYGAIPLGVSLRDGAGSVIFDPAPGWLAAESAAASAGASPAP